MAHRSGLPAAGFVAATNINRVVPYYLESGIFTPRPSVQTLSNAMDVGNPSNLDRILHMYGHDVNRIRRNIRGYSADDRQTLEAIDDVYQRTGYLLDPHSAIGYLGLKSHLPDGNPGIFIATAHPAKFAEVIRQATGTVPDIPDRAKRFLEGEKQSIPISKEWEEFKDFLATMS